ncbi:CCHC-type zinc finger protein, partial [Salmonella enterica]|nr:CCHC-type zinc finger protein [Salmonella enterica]
LHARFKEILNGLASVGEIPSNRDILTKALHAFPRTPTWMSIVDSYYISKDLDKVTLDEFFSQMKLHQTRVEGLEGKEHRSRGVALVVNKEKGKKKKSKSPQSSDSEDSNASMNSEQEVYMVRKMRKEFKSFNTNKSHARKSSRHKSRTRRIICYNCQEEGHMRDECPLLKKKREKKEKEKGKKA